MSKEEIIIMHCDIEKCESKNATAYNGSIQVIFTTEQTEGRPIKPHPLNVKIDLCSSCLQKVCEGNAIFASGAQGYNRYWFKHLPKESNKTKEGKK